MCHPKITIAATFTGEPVEDSLSYWLQQIGIPHAIEFAPYNQVFQELLNPTSLLATNNNGINIVLVRFEDWEGNKNPLQLTIENALGIKQVIKDFGEALKTATMRASNPYLICLCPPSPSPDTASKSLQEKLEEQFVTDLQNIPNLYLIKSQELTNTYPVADYYDPYGEELGHIPYTPTFFCALGTMLARKIWALKRAPYKVIVLDCDHTLWQGVCGEDGVAGVKIDAPFRALQEFIINQQAAGKLICLCSKNQADDVFAVFEQHPDMLLKQNHLVSWRINWESKSKNLKSLAAELQLGLDSFIFIDDNPVECAEVRANCPEVLTLQLPETSDHIPQFLQHIWAFDQLQITQEDQQRTNLYQQNVQRQRLQENTLSLTDFLAQLNLEIEISPWKNEQLSRVAQLTQRTNQFNLTTIRRSEAEIQQLCDSGKLEGRVVKVQDRFGDYGLVGLLLFETQANALVVDTFLLSCRVLGRGVEHKMLAYLGTLAQERGLERVQLSYQPTQKNQPAWEFLNRINKEYKQEMNGGWLFDLSSQTASESIFIPVTDSKSLNINLEETVLKSEQPTHQTDFFEYIARNLYSPELILKEITSQQQRSRSQLDLEFVAPQTPLEKAIASLFEEILKLDQVGIQDNFFELGGDSIKGAILINQLQAKLNEIVHFVVLFDTKTVKSLANYLEENYPQSVAQWVGQKITTKGELPEEKIDETKVLQLRSLIPPLTPPKTDDTVKNPTAIFILSPHRSGSTLLRVMLGGNPQLFAPPELELLRFNTLGERKAAFSGRYSFWMEGVIRTLMELQNCSAESAIAIMEELSTKNLSTQEFYRFIQQKLGDKILVDKTPSYSIDLETLKQAERTFQNPLYIHLVRHPLAMMRSYEEARVDQIFPYDHPFTRRQLAELVWLISHQNILEFLQHIPQERQYQIKFEDIVNKPQISVENLCQFLGVEFHPDMLQPYKEKKQRMTDGIYAESRMMGDVKFHEHQGINPRTADSWKQYYTSDFLGDITWNLAESLGYPRNNRTIPKLHRGNETETYTFPVSFAQQRLWFLAQLEPDSPFYNMFKAVRLKGVLNLEVFERSLNEIIRRHEILRTNFTTLQETPVQLIAPHATLKPSVVNLQGLPEPEQLKQLQLIATQDQLQPFDLTQGLLLRVTLVQLQPESFALLLTMHHIIGDGWSLGVLLKELSSLYHRFLAGDPSPLPELPIQYADFTLWQRQWLQGEGLQSQINYWKQQLAAAPPLLELPTDRSRPAVQTFRGWCYSFEVDAKLTASLKQLSHKSGTTLFMTLMAAYVTLLFRYSAQEDILVGTPIANRNHQEIEGLIGFFVNTLVIRTKLEGNLSFSDLLMQMRATCMEAYANQDVPFEQIIENLQIERSLSYSPLFQVMFALQNTPMEQVKTPELAMPTGDGYAIAPLNLNKVNAKFDLSLEMWETNTDEGNFLQGSWQYNSDLFDEETIARFSSHFLTLLTAIVANSEESVGTVYLLDEHLQPVPIGAKRMNRKVTEGYQLSYNQQALWFIYQLDPKNIAYNIFTTATINSYINIDIFIKVWNKIIERHPILRTTYTIQEDQPFQRINDQHKFQVELINADHWSEDELKEKIFEETDRPFNLETDSVLRIYLFTRSAKEHILLLTMHHIAGDMWSFDLLLSEFQHLYTAEIESATQEQAESVEDFLIQNKSYTEFVRWQSEMLSNESGKKHWQYWKKQLAGELPILNLLPDKPRPPLQTYQGASHLLRLDEQLILKLNNLAQTSGESLYRILLTAFYVLIYRYTNQENILIGSPMRGRWSGDFQEIVGYFVNLIPLRTDVEKNVRFTELLAQVSNTVKEAQNHQDYPFSLLAEQLEPQRDPSRPPLCQVSFTWQAQRWCEPTKNSLHSREQVLQMEPYLLGHQRGADFDLNLAVMEAQGVLQLYWQYNTDLFEATTIARMSGHFVTLLEAIVANPQQQISQFPLLTEAEVQQLLVEWNHTQTNYPQDQCIYQLFEEQVERSPDAIAVEFEKQQLTYRELNHRANQLAHYLRSLGVGADVLVGICVERSLEMVVGLLGILKAGGAYVPLDPTYPQDRLSFMLSDTQIKILVTQENLTHSLPIHEALVVCLDSDWQRINQASQENLHSRVSAENLAYVIYTSGSTGTPKGVVVTHQAVNRLVKNTNYIQLTTDDRIAQASNIAFDAATFEIWGALLNGARLIIITKSVLLSPPELALSLRNNQISILFLTTALFNQLAREVPQAFRGLRYLLFGGEAVDPFWVLEVLRQGTPQQLLHVYGPTENTTFSSWYLVEDLPLNATTVPIGRPIANSQIYILDSHLQPVPIGVPGELHIGGAGLAVGYLNRPELTNEKFIANPLGNKSNSRLYKTGDLARYLPDGNIEYLGRIDNQVKIRGFRIELGEIEAILGQHPQVKVAVVIVREDSPGDKRLVAYVVSDSKVIPTLDELRQYLKTKLPEYMVPSAFVFLETLPLTPNGKVDRRALPTLNFDNAPTENYVAPRTPIEEILTHLFSQLLKVNSVGIDDNFFELGGHSLLATQLVSRIRTHLQVELPLRNLFSAPTVAELASQIQQLQQQNLQLNFQPIVKRENYSDLPLSYAQTRLWFIDQFQPNSALYNIPLAWFLKGTLSKIALEQSLAEIVQRHEILRTNFISIDGQPSQVIYEENQRFLAIVDLQHLETNEQEIAVQHIVQEQTNRPFDLAKDSLIIITLIKLSETEHILMICMHHIISDGWSMGVLMTELASLYNAYTLGQSSPLTGLPIQYPDFAIWQRKWLQGEVLQTQLTYWKQQLADAPALLSLPTDRPRPAVQTYIGTHQKFVLSAELTQKLTQLSQEQGVTLFMTLLASFKTLLYRYTGQSDIVVGSPIANRNHSEIEGLIGFFVNTLVLRTDLSENPKFTELLRRTREISLAAYAHQDLPFEMLVEALQPSRDLSYSPLFQVMFVLQNAPLSELELSGLTLSARELEMPIAKFDLTLSMENTATGLLGVWNYNTDLFDGSTIERMTGHFLTLLEAIVAAPKTAISQLPILTASEQQQLLVEWNNTQTDYPSDQCIHQLFEEQVEKTPDAIAVVFEEQQLTYRELNHRANQLAHYLRSLGVGADVLVGICVERSLEMIVGLLGVLKAGGAYVPLDPEYPAERLRFMLENSQVSVLLTQRRLLERLNITQENLICLDTDWQIIQQWRQDNPITDVQPKNLAYVIYTSGSTGQPKGVMLCHANLCNHMNWMQATFPLTEKDKVLQKTPFGFDASVWEFYAPLLVGGQLVMAQPGGHTDPAYLLNLIAQQQINRVQFVPSLLQMLLEYGGIESCQSLKDIFCGGEVLPVGLQDRLLRKLDVNLHNLYGPTEACIDATFWSCKQQMDRQVVPVGKPIANTEIYILDSYLQPLPIGVPGELHIGGAGLARGYLNRPELTVEKFIPHPFNNQPNSRLYKTGDLARYLPSGNIEYLGRIDNQVKIRGFRIELGEIEAMLSLHPQVKVAVVMAWEDSAGEKRLVAYLVSNAEVIPTVEQLREHLKAKLPEYMVPSAFVFLETLPLTPNSKVDTKALPTPDFHSQRLGTYLAPRTPVEEILVQIWSQVLKVEPVGINDNFFALGGHSLLATQLVSRIRSIFQIELPLKNLFAAPTIAEQAQLIGQIKSQNLELTSPPILPRTKDTELPLSYAQQRLWFLDQLELNQALYNIPIALRLVGNLNISVLEQSLQEIMARHQALRTNFISIDGQATQVIHQTITETVLSVINLKHLSPQEAEINAEQLIQKQAIQPFDLASGTLLKATLILLSETEQILIVCMHHIISDGWSMSILIQELTILYKAYTQGQPSPLTPLTIQYADYAIWQRQWLQASVLENQLKYWQQQLADAPSFIPLPTDRPRPAVQSFIGAHHEIALSKDLTEKLVQLSQEKGVTLFMTLLAAFNTLLYRYTGQTEILVGSPIANRNHREIEELIGFFVNTLVMRTDLSGNPNFSELLIRVREMALSAYAHQDLPFEMLVEALQPERDLSHTPLFQVMFTLQNTPVSTLELAGLSLTSIPVATQTAKFDLTLALKHTNQGLRGVWEYNTDLFERTTIERMTGHFVTLLESIVAAPEQKVSQLSLLTEVEIKQLLVEWNHTQLDYPLEKCIHQLFEEQVERTPDAIAVGFEQQQLTYRDLNNRANQLAHYLRSLGVKADTLVGLCVERSFLMIVGILGILKAGGAYVPLDSEYPTERLSFILEDSQVSVLLTQQKLRESLPQHQAQVICLDSDWNAIAQQSESNPPQTTISNNLAYVIYTSGSTGKPKGVLVNHSNVVRLFAATQDWYHFNAQDVWTLFHSYAFDFSVWEIWGALLYGGRLVIVPYFVTRSPESFYQLLVKEKVTVLNQTPSAFRQLISAEESLATQAELKLRLVIFGGEALELKSLQPWFERHGDQMPQLVNMYGITETTVHVTYRPLSLADLEGVASVIGRPIPDLKVYVLDEYWQPVPIGIKGELYVGGAGVTRGYLNRDELTAQRFISSPFDDSKLYKTGDLARSKPNGELEYLGRIDNQVKIRGFRIELGEIEAALASHPALRENVVIVREDEPGDKRLVAYVVAKAEPSPQVAELRQFLTEQLPNYMIPNAIVVLESLPLTANGKVDQRALPKPDLYSQPLDKYIAPRSPTEERLAEIWTEVLKVERVGINDNFFVLGGHSLLATQLVSRIRDRFQIELPLRELFSTASLADLAKSIESLQQQNLGTPTPISPILPRRRS